MGIELREVLRATKVVGGAWGTELGALGRPAGRCLEEWNLSQPEKVGRVAAAYVEAGADIILTNSFGANRFALERHGFSENVEGLNRVAAQIGRQAAGERVWLFGLMGPSGRMVVAEEVTDGELYNAYCVQAKALAAGSVDAIVLESMTELAEVLAGVRAVKDATGLPVVASMTFDTGVDYMRTAMGVEVSQAAEELSKAGVDAIGCNCGVGIEACNKIAQCLRQRSDLPVWVRPNAGQPEIVEGEIVYREKPEEFASRGPQLLRAGANFIGGCCGVAPGHIAKLATAVRPWLSAG